MLPCILKCTLSSKAFFVRVIAIYSDGFLGVVALWKFQQLKLWKVFDLGTWIFVCRLEIVCRLSDEVLNYFHKYFLKTTISL